MRVFDRTAAAAHCAADMNNALDMHNNARCTTEQLRLQRRRKEQRKAGILVSTLKPGLFSDLDLSFTNSKVTYVQCKEKSPL